MRWDVINELLEHTAGRRFLEVGCQYGNCGRKVNAAEKHGVDPEPLKRAERIYRRFFKGPSDAYFRQLDAGERFDVILVDGLHHAGQVLRDTDNALQHLAEGGFVVLHDCNPQSELAQRVPRETGVWNGDCWKAIVELRRRGDVDAFTIDSDHGVGIVRRRSSEPLTDVPSQLTYQALELDRERLLGLVQPDDWQERVGVPVGLGRVVVVSANFGGRDEPAPAPASSDVDDFVLFTDGEPVEGWHTVAVDPSAIRDWGGPRMAARRIKTLALELLEADVVLWVDGRIRVQGLPLRPLLRKALRGTDIAGYPHPWRDCAYDEASECSRLGLVEPEAVRNQVEGYGREGFPQGAGLQNTMVLARRRTKTTVELGRRWWDEISRHTPRDQVSLPFVLWRMGLRFGQLGRDVYRVGSSPYFERGGHAK